jgi:hypothetical protein
MSPKNIPKKYPQKISSKNILEKMPPKKFLK